jgi:RNA polymerase sigma-70 factor (ECF subfamily)
MSGTRIETGDAALAAETPQQAFERLMRPHLRRLHRLACRLTGSASDAEDLLQDVLIRLFERANELSSIADLRPWTSRVLYNRYIDSRRRARKRRFEIAAANANESVNFVMESAAASTPGPEEEALRSFEVRRLDSALSRLSDDHRIVVLLHDAEGCTLEEIASMTGNPLGTVKSRLHRARERLREMWAEGTLSGPAAWRGAGE